MPKIKTHKAISKKIKKRPSGGPSKIGTPSGRHNTGKKNAKFNRKKRKGSTLSKTDAKRLKSVKY